MHPGDTKPAPEPLALVQRFVNTKSLMRGYDLLQNRQSATEWLAEAGYGVPDEALGGEELGLLCTLREGLREILLSHNVGPTVQSERAASDLSRIVDSAALVVGFDSSGQPLLLSSSTGVERLVGDLMAAAVWAQYTGIWHRLKVCASEDCRWVFYDRSRNRSGSWCDMEVCGSRAKMRAYRKRRGSTS